MAAPGVAVKAAAHDSHGGLRTLSGISMVAPHVTGIAALWMEEFMSDGPSF